MEEQKRFILDCEREFREKIVSTARRILDFDVNFVLVSGPSSAGKTTFARILSEQLLLLAGKRSVFLSLDNYFYDKSNVGEQEWQKLDFESIGAIDIEAFFRDMNAIIEGRRVALPVFDFTIGAKRDSGVFVDGAQCDIVVIEGLHALNTVIIETLVNYSVLTVFLNPAATIPLPSGDMLSGVDLRFLRRLVRDYRFRASSVGNTFRLWDNVRRGEVKYVFPESENADVELDTTHLYEVGVLRPQAQALLSEVGEDSRYYHQARRLLHILEQFEPVDEALVPEDSLLREFIGRKQ